MQKFDKKDISRLRTLIDDANSVVIVSHMAPDGDALGSSLGMAQVLEFMGKEVRVVVPNTPTRQLRFLPGFKYIYIYKEDPAFADSLFNNADLIISLDFNVLTRIDRAAATVRAAKAPKVLIDHHINPEEFAAVTISRPEESSTCMLLFKVLCALELVEAINRECADCLLTGMLTDTGNFSFNGNDPEAYRIVAELVARGANHDRLVKLLFDTSSQNCLRLNAFAIADKMQVWEDKGCALITLTLEELKRFHSQTGDTEGLVNKPLAIPQVRCSCFLREEDDFIKVSMRSKGSLPVDKICSKYFGGGGHRNAAGGEFKGNMQQCIDKFVSLLDEIAAYQ